MLGVVSLLLGVAGIVAFFVLQSLKVSMDGTSISASQANGICQSSLGQLGQAFSSGFGDNSPASLCNKAATIEDWKAITLWLGIALILFGLGRLMGTTRRIPGGTANLRTSVSPGRTLGTK